MTEQEIINHYDKLLWKHVHNFKGRCKGTTIPDEDLIQAARMAFLEHIRTHKPEEWSRCGFTILHALCDEVRMHYPLCMPHAVFIDKKKRGTLFLMDLNHAKGLKAEDGHKEQETLDAILSEAETISQECMQLVNLKRQGYTNREAVQKIGKSDTWASCTLNKLHQRYME